MTPPKFGRRRAALSPHHAFMVAFVNKRMPKQTTNETGDDADEA